MLKIVKSIATITIKNASLQQRRNFLSQAYYCREVWEQRFMDPIIQKTGADELYMDLDQQYNKVKNISAIDVDIYANAINDPSHSNELLDLVHKLRLSADTCNTLASTPHAVIRNLVDFAKMEELLSALDDRLNYGLFLDHFTANLLLDTFWKNNDYRSGSRVASQLMLQEDFEHPLCAALSLLHCYNYLLNPTEWPQPPKPEEPEDEVKVRLNFLRNPYDDRHFDLRDPNQIVGKTIKMITVNQKDTLEKSLYLVGTALFEGQDETEKLITRYIKANETIYEDALKLVPQDFDVKGLATQQADLNKLLQDRVRLAMETTSEKDIALQCDTYIKWEKERKTALEKQQERLLTHKRIADIQEMQEKLKEKETLLWYFENEEKIELQIEEKDEILAKATQNRSIPLNTEEVYIPPEVQKKRAK